MFCFLQYEDGLEYIKDNQGTDYSEIKFSLCGSAQRKNVVQNRCDGEGKKGNSSAALHSSPHTGSSDEKKRADCGEQKGGGQYGEQAHSAAAGAQKQKKQGIPEAESLSAQL